MNEFDWRKVKVKVVDAKVLESIDPEVLRKMAVKYGYTFTEKWRFSDAYGIRRKSHAIYIPTSSIADLASVMSGNVAELAQEIGITELTVLERLITEAA